MDEPGADKYCIPKHIKDALDRYVMDHIPTGGHLRGILCNNLTEAMLTVSGDEELGQVYRIFKYIYWELPGNCWGSYEAYNKWVGKR
jgi:hypothetical protein